MCSFGRYLIMGAALAAATPGLSEPATDPATRVAARMAEDRLPSLSVAVGARGAIVYAAAFGLADVENEVPATTRTVYRIGSVSKAVTATAVLQLSEAGKLDLDLPVQTYCAEFPDKGAPISSRLLLAHLGGIRGYDYRRFRTEFLSNTRYPSVGDALTVFDDDPLAAPPGQRHIYSSFGYGLLGCAIEGAGGMGFGDYLEHRIVRVSGMAQTRLDVPEVLIPHRARPYSRNENGEWENSPPVDLSDRYPAGGLLSTPSDLVRFGLALLDGRLLGKDAWAAMITPQETESGENLAYGLGWRLSLETPEEVFHGGTAVGGSAYLYLRTDRGIVVAVATNVDRWTESRHELSRALADWAEQRLPD